MLLDRISTRINSWLADKYGTRRGGVRSYRYRMLHMMGGYGKYRQIDWENINRLVFVCKGNICRSAYAEAFAKSLGLTAISCGIDTEDGKPADSRAIITAAARGVDLRKHSTSRVQSLTLHKQDLIVAMEPSQLEYMEDQYKSNSLTLLGLWGRPVKPYIQDPYGASDAYFRRCFHYIEESVCQLAEKASESKG